MEQLEFGNVGADGVTVMLNWSWDQGWRCRFATRPSGATVWREHAYEGLDAAELHAVVSDHLADALGLI